MNSSYLIIRRQLKRPIQIGPTDIPHSYNNPSWLNRCSRRQMSKIPVKGFQLFLKILRFCKTKSLDFIEFSLILAEVI